LKKLEMISPEKEQAVARQIEILTGKLNEKSHKIKNNTLSGLPGTSGLLFRYPGSLPMLINPVSPWD
jgi:hypothetical protein